MSKKTLLALATLGAFAGGVAAANVELYGIVDVGLQYQYSDLDDGTDSDSSFTMESGNQSGSRFGLKGSEDLGNGYKVGFVLENGFSPDTGSLAQNSRLFGREAQVNLSGAFGEISFGRVGQLASGSGSYGIAGSMSPFGTSFSGVNAVEGSTFMVGMGRTDNTITYKSPDFAGARFYAQYSFDFDSKESWSDSSYSRNEGKSTSNRYAALGATYGNDSLKAAFVVDWYNWSSNWERYTSRDLDDGYSVTLGGSYDFGVVKAYLGVQYFDNIAQRTTSGSSSSNYTKLATLGAGTSGYITGYSIMAGVDAPLFGGTAMFAVGYADTEDADDDLIVGRKSESNRYGISAGYSYNLSKRTNLYGVVAYCQDDVSNYRKFGYSTIDDADYRDRDQKYASFVVGMRHRF